MHQQITNSNQAGKLTIWYWIFLTLNCTTALKQKIETLSNSVVSSQESCNERSWTENKQVNSFHVVWSIPRILSWPHLKTCPSIHNSASDNRPLPFANIESFMIFGKKNPSTKINPKILFSMLERYKKHSF